MKGSKDMKKSYMKVREYLWNKLYAVNLRPEIRFLLSVSWQNCCRSAEILSGKA